MSHVATSLGIGWAIANGEDTISITAAIGGFELGVSELGAFELRATWFIGQSLEVHTLIITQIAELLRDQSFLWV